METLFVLQVDGKKYRITKEILRKIPYLEIVKKYSSDKSIRVMNSKHNKLFAIVLKAICDPVTFTLRFFSLRSGHKRLLRVIQYYCVSIDDIFQARVDDATPQSIQKTSDDKTVCIRSYTFYSRYIASPVCEHCLYRQSFKSIGYYL
jgi:hypothetical protein